MCTPVIVTEENANDLITAPGNPHLIWDGAEARVITEDFYRALNAGSAWLLIMTRADLADLDPAALDLPPRRAGRIAHHLRRRPRRRRLPLRRRLTPDHPRPPSTPAPGEPP